MVKIMVKEVNNEDIKLVVGLVIIEFLKKVVKKELV